ncbi:E3 ubiquitin-protein ligase RING1-like [Camellia lanceoleosa]|uniref:E3 ubiquitin-protein ligase RING1-like n=1 Tax=Camellia lanceoleosa TaxID=1840588 RepID=A0ACC0HW56_9ERIC|nr:E3 ubiquitin-protein ligase RING1-like [Camellia lanceoleosa]
MSILGLVMMVRLIRSGRFMPLFWGCLGFKERKEANNDEFEWERVNEEGEERKGLSLVIDRIEQLSVASQVSINEESSDIREEASRDFEWEVLLAVHNLDRLHELDHHDNSDGISYLDVRDGYIYVVVYNTLLGQFVQNKSALKGNPPASKAVVENLLSVALTKKKLQENNVVCAVCKDEILVEEKVIRLPCRHH